MWLPIPAVAGGLTVLTFGAERFVLGASALARGPGVTPLLIGLTIVAIGTSLPELATSIAAAWQGEAALAVGNVIGSNLFNLLCVLAIPGLPAPWAVENAVLIRDHPVMLGLMVLLFALALGRGVSPGRVHRWEEALLLGLLAPCLILLAWTTA
jgi:cation:H+ antiporter